MINIDLKYSFNQQWYCENGISVIGFAYSNSNQTLRNGELISHFKIYSKFNGF
jgi:hypothetical protein